MKSRAKMDRRLFETFRTIKKRDLELVARDKDLMRLGHNGTHEIPESSQDTKAVKAEGVLQGPNSIYATNDFSILLSMTNPQGAYTTWLKSLDELLEWDTQRERDGFPRKIRVGRLIKPGKGGREKIVIVPTTVEEKFLHDNTFRPLDEDFSSGGSGEGEEGEVVGEQPVHEQEGDGSGPGEGGGNSHEMESSAYDLGKILSKQFELPNIKDKGKKRFLSHYTYEMIDKNRGVGQFLDKKATLQKIVETNINLGNLPDIASIDPSLFIISPQDKIYRILSREKFYESQALVFFLRDYSGSMDGRPTQVVVAQHVLIYSWLLYQYAKQVESRFILHDTDATEVPDFYTYYNSKVAGGTKVSSAFHLVNEIVENEGLARDYNIYIFYGTDGDDWDTGGKEALPEITRALDYSNRIGITVVKHTQGINTDTEVESYIKNSGLLERSRDLLHLDVMGEYADEPRLLEGIRNLIS
ncbi:MAG: DUF444 family protein [Thermodesulfobacteriota bacterium]|nr:DUF444 family protein [Thermodesulfobacteriota bacterium]